MENKKSPLPEHVLRAMRRDDGYIIAESAGYGKVRYVVYVRTTDGYKSMCAVSDADMKLLYSEGYIKPTGTGKWKLTEKGKEE